MIWLLVCARAAHDARAIVRPDSELARRLTDAGGAGPSGAAGGLVRTARHGPAAAVVAPPAAGPPAHALAARPLRRRGCHARHLRPQCRHAAPVAAHRGHAPQAAVPRSPPGP